MQAHALARVICAPSGSSEGLNAEAALSAASERARERDEAWLRRIRIGDDSAFESMFREYYDPLTRFAASYLHDADAASGIVSDVFLAVWDRRSSWIPEQGVAAYLFGAVRNRAHTHERSRRRFAQR